MIPEYEPTETEYQTEQLIERTLYGKQLANVAYFALRACLILNYGDHTDARARYYVAALRARAMDSAPYYCNRTELDRALRLAQWTGDLCPPERRQDNAP